MGKTRNYTHISYIIIKLALWRIWICNNSKMHLLLLYVYFVIAGHKFEENRAAIAKTDSWKLAQF